MKHVSFATTNCSLAQSIEMVGEWWSLLILREAFLGVRRFSDFERYLGISRNILTARLSKLVAAEILERAPARDGGKRLEYFLTAKGRELYPVVVAIMQWGDKWATGPGREPMRILDKQNREEIARITVCARDGRELTARDVAYAPGPGSDAVIRRRLAEYEKRRS